MIVYKVISSLKLGDNTVVTVNAKNISLQNNSLILDTQNRVYRVLSIGTSNNMEVTNLLIQEHFDSSEIIINNKLNNIFELVLTLLNCEPTVVIEIISQSSTCKALIEGDIATMYQSAACCVEDIGKELNIIKSPYSKYFTSTNISKALDYIRLRNSKLQEDNKGVLPNLPFTYTTKDPDKSVVALVAKQDALKQKFGLLLGAFSNSDHSLPLYDESNLLYKSYEEAENTANDCIIQNKEIPEDIQQFLLNTISERKQWHQYCRTHRRISYPLTKDEIQNLFE